MKKNPGILCWACWSVAILMLVGCAAKKPAMTTDPELSRVAGVARMSFEQGSLEQSARLYARALRIARKMDDAREVGSNAYNLAACLAELGRYPEALGYLHEAQAEFDRAGRPLADVLLLKAKIALLDGRYDEALSYGDQVVPAAQKPGQDSYAVQVMLLRTDVAIARGSMAEAQAEFDRAKKEVQRIRDPLLNAQAAGVEGRILQLAGSFTQAAEGFDRQAELLRGVARFREMAHALGRAGEAYQQAGLFAPAGDRFYRAARSLYAQGDDLMALKMIQAALAAGEKSGDENAFRSIAALFEEVRARVENSVKKSPTETSNDAGDI